METQLFKFLMLEYDKLKDEQHKRIEFRDHMIYLTLGAIGTLFSFSLEKPQFNIAFLILPFINIVLGWTYLVNDEKISSIGKYLKNELIPKLSKLENQLESVCQNNWELFLSKDKERKSRKQFQFIIDISLFCISSISSIIVFFVLHKQIFWVHYIVVLFELILISFLAYKIYKYSEL